MADTPQWALAQARIRAPRAEDAARETARGVGDLARLIGDVTLSQQERSVLAGEIAERTAAAVKRLDAEEVPDQLEVTVK